MFSIAGWMLRFLQVFFMRMRIAKLFLYLENTFQVMGSSKVLFS